MTPREVALKCAEICVRDARRNKDDKYGASIAKQLAEEIRAYADTLPADEGVVVPREPTQEMMVAGWNALIPREGDCLLGNAYRAMLAAAPGEAQPSGKDAK